MKNKKTIFYLRTDINKEKLIAGGSVSHTLGVIEGLLGHSCTVIVASSTMIEQFDGLKIKSLKSLYIPKKMQWLKWKPTCLISNIVFTYQCYIFLKQYSIDKIYQRYAILNFTGILLSKIKKVPLILEYNGSEAWVDTFWAPKRLIKLTWLIRLIEWINVCYASLIVVVSSPLKDELVKRGIDAKKILINPNGVNTERLDPIKLKEVREIVRKKLNNVDTFIFGFIGTFSQWHGINILVSIIPEIIKSNANSHFLLIGDGDLLPYLQDHLKQYIDEKKVTCTGLLASNLAKEYLAACDAFLSPTQPNPDGTPFFGSPTKLFEYLSIGRPIIASNLNQVAEIVSPALKVHDLNNKTKITDQVGIIVDPMDCNGFVEAAICLMGFDDDEKYRMGMNARNKAIAEYDWQKHVEKILMERTEN